jgi:hypothetical protein
MRFKLNPGSLVLPIPGPVPQEPIRPAFESQLPCGLKIGEVAKTRIPEIPAPREREYGNTTPVSRPHQGGRDFMISPSSWIVARAASSGHGTEYDTRSIYISQRDR